MVEEVFHACDLGNPCLEYDNYISWVALLVQEFDHQASLEQALQL
jgi:hypothetical protein